MADDAAPATTGGQAGAGQSNTAATGAASDGDSGQGKAASGDNGTSGTTKKSSDSASQSDEQTFIDPKQVPPELMGNYKSMQAAFTKAMQKLSGDRGKIQFYDQFAADPVGNMQKLAAQYGYRMTREQAAAAVNQQNSGASDDIPADWQPQSWKEVMERAEERAARKIFGQLQPLLAEVKTQKRQSIEKQLSEIDPTWQRYENDMMELIHQHPSLASDPEKLYRLAVPNEEILSRATQQAIKRMEEKALASAGAGGSRTNKKPSAVDPNQRFGSVQEAAAWAQKKLQEEGKWPPK